MPEIINLLLHFPGGGVNLATMRIGLSNEWEQKHIYLNSRQSGVQNVSGHGQ